MNVFVFVLLLILLLVVLAIGITMIIIRHKYSNPTGLLIAGIILTIIGVIGLILLFYYFFVYKPKPVVKVFEVNSNTGTVVTTNKQLKPRLIVVEEDGSKSQPEILQPIRIPA
jgi:CHASE2 domain-containing sensor protein